MNMEEYWPQHKIFFIATLSLFPEQLRDMVVTEVFYKPFFAKDDSRFIELTLMEYEKDGYLKYEESGEYGWKITEINAQKASDDLIEYLDRWQSNELRLLSIKKPADSSQQQKFLYEALVGAYKLTPGDELRLTLDDIYESPRTDIFGTPFWELVLSMQFSEHPKANITHIGYDRSEDGLYKDDAQPYVDFKITNQELLRSLGLASKSSEPLDNEDPREYSYNGLLACRDGSITYRGVKIPFTQQQTDVMRVLMRRPEELRTYEDFTDPHANIFGNKPLTDERVTLSKLVSATRKKLDNAVGQNCVTNTASQGWTLKIHPT